MRWCMLLLLGLSANLSAAITGPFNQATGVANGATNVNITITAPTAGYSLVAVVSCQMVSTVSSVTGGGVTWARGPNTTFPGNDLAIEIWYGFNSSGSGTTVGVAFNQGSYCDVTVSQWGGGIDSLDGTASATTGSCTNFATPSITTTASEALVIGGYAAFVASSTATPSNSFVALTTPDATMMRAAYLIGSAGAHSTTWNDSQCVNFATAIIGFKASGGAPPASPRFRSIILQ